MGISRDWNTQLELDNDKPIGTLFPQSYLCLECKLDYPLNEMAQLTVLQDEGCCVDCFNEDNGYV